VAFTTCGPVQGVTLDCHRMLRVCFAGSGQWITPARVRRAVEATCMPLGGSSPDAVLTYGRGLLQVRRLGFGGHYVLGQYAAHCACMYTLLAMQQRRDVPACLLLKV
jgi:hypothetical protein